MAAAFNDAETELIGLQEQIRKRLDSQAVSELEAWIQAQRNRLMNPLAELIDLRVKVAEMLREAAESKDIGLRDRVQTHLETMHPKTFAEELRGLSKFKQMWEEYERVVSGLGETPVGKMAARYSFPQQVVQVMCGHCSAPFTTISESLKEHARQVKTHTENLGKISDDKIGKGLGAATKVVSSIGVSLIAGAAGVNPVAMFKTKSRASSEMGSSVAGWYYESKVNKSIGQVDASFSNLQSAYTEAFSEVDTRVKLALTTLYGGMMVRVEDDLNRLERSVESVDFSSSRVLIGLHKSGRERLRTWYSDAVQSINQLEKEDRWYEAAAAAESALKVCLSDPNYVREVDEDGIAYPIRFARRRARAINKLGHAAWQNQQYTDAARLYSRLFTGPQVAWEVEAAASSVNVWKSGWRYTIVASSSLGQNEGVNDLTLFVQYIYGILTRFEEESDKKIVPGELLSANSQRVAHVVARFLADTSRTHMWKGALPSTVTPLRNADAWTAPHSERPGEYEEDIQLRDDIPKELDLRSDLAGWVQEEIKSVSRSKMLRKVLAYTIITAIVACIIYYFI